jgi:hypothetical protein
MTHRRLAVLLLCSLLVAVAITLIGIHSTRGTKERISWRSYQQIELGMTQRDVEDITGVPPGSHLNLPEGETQAYVHQEELSKGEAHSPHNYSWVGNKGNLGVGFDEDGRVVRVSFTPLESENPTFLQRLYRWLFGE